jgi:hypothetical protein
MERRRRMARRLSFVVEQPRIDDVERQEDRGAVEAEDEMEADAAQG